MNVSACLVTRGDVDLTQIISSIENAGISDIVVWDNSEREDLAVYGRYAAIKEAKYPLIYVQDDDCLHQPEGIKEICWVAKSANGKLVCNMPANFRHSFYQDHALVGFGACFHRDAPWRAFGEFARTQPEDPDEQTLRWFWRTCDIVFTGLTPYTMVDVLYEDMSWASADNRMWKQPTHREERGRMLELVKEMRDV